MKSASYSGNILRYQQYSSDPLRFFTEILGINNLYHWQKEVLEYIKKDFCNSDKQNKSTCIAIAGGNGSGKSYLGKLLMLWHFATQFESRNIMMTNSERQTKRTGYSTFQDQLRKLFDGKDIIGSDIRICFKLDDKCDTEGVWDMAFFLKSTHESALAGLHCPRMYFFYDECVSFPDYTWRALENMTTQGRVLIYCASNPVETGTYFHDIFLKTESGEINHWYTKNVSLLDLPEGSFDADFIAKKRALYGSNDPRFINSVLGRFIDTSSSYRFSRDRIYNCMLNGRPTYNTLAPIVMAVDIAEDITHGSSSAICVKKGLEILWIRSYAYAYEDFRTILLGEIERTRPEIVVIDSNGVGAGLYYEIKRMGLVSNVFDIKAHGIASDTERFDCRKTELAWKCSEWFRSGGVYLPEDEDLLRVLPKMTFGFDAKGRISLVSKKELRKDSSIPNGALDKVDALFYTFSEEERSSVQKTRGLRATTYGSTG